jgi:DNA-binding NtrC family response regulator
MRILLIDDDLNSLSVFSSTLELNGYECKAFQSSVEAMKDFMKTKYDLVIVDFNMPNFSGIDVLKSILLINPKANIIVYTGYTDVNIEKTALSNGAAYFFYKPIEWKDLLKVLLEIRIHTAL